MSYNVPSVLLFFIFFLYITAKQKQRYKKPRPSIKKIKRFLRRKKQKDVFQAGRHPAGLGGKTASGGREAAGRTASKQDIYS